MMGRRYFKVGGFLVLAALASAPTLAQDTQLQVIFRGNLTTGSQLFPNPNSVDAGERASFLPLESVFGLGIEVRYKIPETNIALGLSTDYITKVRSLSISTLNSISLPVEDGYRVIPVELTAYFLIPVSGPAFSIYMGGGGGVYIGRRVYRFAGTEARTVEQGHGFGIHVLGGVGYQFTSWFGLNGEMKFRDLQFKASNAFDVSSIVYNNTVIRVGREPFESRIHTDGIVFQLGAVFSF
jgi:hypothetical protein